MVFEAVYQKEGNPNSPVKRITFYLSDSVTDEEKQLEIESATPDGYVFFDPDRGTFFQPQLQFLFEGRPRVMTRLGAI